MQLADDIIDNPTLSKWFGAFPIANHGVFTIHRQGQNASGQKAITRAETLRLLAKGKHQILECFIHSLHNTNKCMGKLYNLL